MVAPAYGRRRSGSSIFGDMAAQLQKGSPNQTFRRVVNQAQSGVTRLPNAGQGAKTGGAAPAGTQPVQPPAVNGQQKVNTVLGPMDPALAGQLASQGFDVFGTGAGGAGTTGNGSLMTLAQQAMGGGATPAGVNGSVGALPGVQGGTGAGMNVPPPVGGLIGNGMGPGGFEPNLLDALPGNPDWVLSQILPGFNTASPGGQQLANLPFDISNIAQMAILAQPGTDPYAANMGNQLQGQLASMYGGLLHGGWINPRAVANMLLNPAAGSPLASVESRMSPAQQQAFISSALNDVVGATTLPLFAKAFQANLGDVARNYGASTLGMDFGQMMNDPRSIFANIMGGRITPGVTGVGNWMIPGALGS